MADDCVCTALTSIYTMQSDLFTQMISRLNAISTNIASVNSRLSTIVTLMRNEENGQIISFTQELKSLKESIDDLSTKFMYNNKNIAEIWSYKELCVSNETIVESPLSTFVSKAKLDVDE